MIRRIVLPFAGVFAFAWPAMAQAPALDDPEGAIVEELVVVARDRGPAWWRVSDDDTTVYILALPDTGLIQINYVGGLLPPRLRFDIARRESVIDY